MKIEILGMGCPKCKQLYENAQAAVKELNMLAEITKIEDLEKITAYGAWMTPAIAVNGSLKSGGKVLSVEEIKKLLS